MFRNAIQKDSGAIVAHYGLTLFFATPANPNNQIDSANNYLVKTKRLIDALDPQQTDRLKKIPLNDFVLDGLSNKIDSAAFTRAQQKNTIDSYEKYLAMFTNGKFRTDAIYRRDELAFNISNQKNSIESLKTFIENYPESEFKKIALQKVEIGLAEKAIKSKSAGLLNEFLLQFPNSNFKETIIQTIWETVTRYGSPESFQNFINQFPEHALADLSKKIILFKIGRAHV